VETPKIKAASSKIADFGKEFLKMEVSEWYSTRKIGVFHPQKALKQGRNP